MENISTVQPENYPGNNINSSRSKTNHFIIVVLVLFILLISVGSFVLGKYFTSFQKQPEVTQIKPNKTAVPSSIVDQTANWETYTNNRYLYEFKYPDTWFHYDDNENNPPSFYSENVSAPLEMSNKGISLVIYQGKYTGKDTSTKKVVYQIGNNNLVKSWHTPIPNLPTEQGYNLNYQVTNNGSTILQFDFLSFSEKTIQNNEKLFDQILSTFRFLDDATTTVTPQTTGTENWKTYNNQIHKYLIKYPTDFDIVFCSAENCQNPEDNILIQDKNQNIKITAEYARQWSLCANETLPCKPVNNFSIEYPKTVTEVEKFYSEDQRQYLFRVFPQDINNTQIDIFGKFSNINDVTLINQILSTFKFF